MTAVTSVHIAGLDNADLERLADLVADRIVARLGVNGKDAGMLLTASEIARRYGVTRSWCYEHAGQLGAIRLGNGPRPRLRFNPDTVERRLSQASDRPDPPAVAQPRRRRRDTSGRTTNGAPLLQIKDAA